MFDLLAVSHEGLTLEKIQAIPAKETHANLLSWLDRGGKPNIRIASNEDPQVLRKIQASLAFHGVKTLISERIVDTSNRPAARSGMSFTPPPAKSVMPSRKPLTPEERRREDERASGSGLLAFREMVAEQDERRSTASHLISTTVGGFRPWHLAVIVALALLGAIFALASRG